ncbi:MAG: hypothetical protein B9S32_14590 [Verrucomicrobia bacterium Tous-C9LFEB]|nr:MAG: hypothetical protein B9S32_14590 [Verrucomicrobia bacterium Tous-C9LFEB]
MKLSHVICVCCLMTSSLQAERIIADAFHLTGARKSGVMLNGLVTEEGNATWDAYNNVVLKGDAKAGFLEVDGDGSTRAQVPLVVESGKVSMSCRVTNGEEGGSERWIALGFSNDKKATLWNEANPALGGQVYVVLSAGGKTTVYEGTAVLKSGEVRDFHRNEFNNVKLVFDFATLVLTVTVNGEDFYAGAIRKSPSIKWARIELQNPKPSVTKVDQFRVETSD